MPNVVISATESQFSVMKNKISIVYFLYDANGKAVPDNITAVKQKITLSYDLYMENTTEDYTDESEYGQGERETYNIFNSVIGDTPIKTTTIYPKEYSSDKISEIIKNYCEDNKNIKNISISVTNPNEMISVTPELMQYLFDTYESIEIDMNSISSWLTFPDGTHNIKSLSVTNSNIILKDSKFLCEGDINLNNCTIKSIYDDKQSVADFVSNKQVYVSSIYISNVISVGFGISTNLPVPVWKKTNINISKINVVCEDKEVRNFTKPIIRVSGSYTTSISEVNCNYELPDYNILTLIGGKEYNISDISRISTDQMRSDTISLQNVSKFKLSGLTVNSISQYNESLSVIKILNPPINSDYSISNFNLSNINLVNLTNITLNKLDISDGVCKDSYDFIRSKGSGINKIIINDVEVEGNTATLKFTAGLIDNLSLKTDDDISITNTDNLVINNSSFNSKKDINVDNWYNSDFSSNSTMYYAKNITFDRTKTIGDDVDMTDVPDQLISLFKCEFVGSFFAKNIDFIDASESHFRNVSSLKFDNVDSLSIDSNVWYNDGPIDLSFNKCNLLKTSIATHNINRKAKFVLTECTGNLGIRTLDIDDKRTVIINIIKSILTVLIKNESTSSLVVECNSNKSLGSKVLGDGVSITPSISCEDFKNFEYTSENKSADEDHVYYGNY